MLKRFDASVYLDVKTQGGYIQIQQFKKKETVLQDRNIFFLLLLFIF